MANSQPTNEARVEAKFNFDYAEQGGGKDYEVGLTANSQEPTANGQELTANSQ